MQQGLRSIQSAGCPSLPVIQRGRSIVMRGAHQYNDFRHAYANARSRCACLMVLYMCLCPTILGRPSGSHGFP